MNQQKGLEKRSNLACELCNSTDNLQIYEVPPSSKGTIEDSAYLCPICIEGLEGINKPSIDHWRCLNESIWNENNVIKVLSWRMLYRMKDEDWTQDLLDMMIIDTETLEWAKSTEVQDDINPHLDSNGIVLRTGDNVVLIQDLDVKGANFIAKRGTPVRRITLVSDNTEHIEGKINGQQIVILTKYVKKSKV